MKQLIFLRHAKSDWLNEGLQDIDRYLSERGYGDAYRLAKWFSIEKKKPELIVCSTATRALSTAMIFSRALELGTQQFKLNAQLYEANTSRIAKVIAEQDNQVNSLLMVGHNPGFTDMINLLSEELYFDNIPTCGIVAFDCKASSWEQVATSKWPVAYYQFPKEFKNQ